MYGEELAIVHRTVDKRFNVNVKMKKLSDGFTLQTMDMWLWSEIV
ncbi:unknown [Bacillus subtilis E1]|nr:unknown [Bacillus subtilis E1]